jgi:hypothetical protein
MIRKLAIQQGASVDCPASMLNIITTVILTAPIEPITG